MDDGNHQTRFNSSLVSFEGEFAGDGWYRASLSRILFFPRNCQRAGYGLGIFRFYISKGFFTMDLKDLRFLWRRSFLLLVWNAEEKGLNPVHCADEHRRLSQ